MRVRGARGQLGRGGRLDLAVVLGLVLLSAVLRAWPAWLVPAPWFAGDEVIYALLGQGLWREGKLAILGGPTGFISLVWPAIAGLPLSLGDLERGYRILRVVQPLLMSLAAVPAYLWARRLGTGIWALAAAALTLALPALGYSSFVMTEVAYYPLVTLALLAAAAMLERPTARRQALFAGALALAVLTRVQAIVLVPVVVSALVVEALLAREPRRSSACSRRSRASRCSGSPTSAGRQPRAAPRRASSGATARPRTGTASARR